MSAREDLLRYLIRYGGICRGCADENGVCPQTGIGCGERRKATEFFAEALEYGTKHGFAAGYRLVAPGELDAETVERCAEVADKFARKPVKAKTPTQFERTKQVVQTGKRIASAIRSLTPGFMEGRE